MNNNSEKKETFDLFNLIKQEELENYFNNSLKNRLGLCNELNTLLNVLKEEYLIPDTHPDVQEILTVEARPMIINKEIIGDKIILEGKVEYTVIYLAREDGIVVNSVNYNQSFTNNKR